MARRDEKFVLRMPDGWRDTLKIMAAKNRRSMTQEVLAALEPTVTREMEAQATAQK